MIVITVAASLVTYAWVMGYLEFTTNKAGESIQIQSIANSGSDLLVYLQNVGSGTVELDPTGAAVIYINGVSKLCNVSKASLREGETVTLNVVGEAVEYGEKVRVKVTTLSGAFMEGTYSSSEKVEYSLIVNAVGSGQVVMNPDQAVHYYGDIVEVTAIADTGWTFSGWSGDLTGSMNPDSFTVTESMTILATFTQNEYTLTVNVVGNGYVNRDNPGPYYYGDVVQLTAVNDPGWSFSGWSGDLGGTTNPATIVIDGDKTVTATFTPNPPQTLILRPNGRGSRDNLRNSAGSSDSNNWQFVDEASADTGTYVYDNDAGDYDYDTYRTQDHGTTSGNINSVTVYIRCRRHPRGYSSSGSTCYARTALRIGGTTYYGNQNTLSNSWVTYSRPYPTNPGGGAWTWAAIDSLECGVSLRSGDTGGSSRIYAACTQVYVVVEYVPP